MGTHWLDAYRAFHQGAAIGPHGAEVDDLALLVHVLQVERGSPVAGFVLGGKRELAPTLADPQFLLPGCVSFQPGQRPVDCEERVRIAFPLRQGNRAEALAALGKLDLEAALLRSERNLPLPGVDAAELSLTESLPE